MSKNNVMKIRFHVWGLEIKFVENYFFLKSFRGSRFQQCFIPSTALHYLLPIVSTAFKFSVNLWTLCFVTYKNYADPLKKNIYTVCVQKECHDPTTEQSFFSFYAFDGQSLRLKLVYNCRWTTFSVCNHTKPN